MLTATLAMARGAAGDYRVKEPIQLLNTLAAENVGPRSITPDGFKAA